MDASALLSSRTRSHLPGLTRASSSSPSALVVMNTSLPACAPTPSKALSNSDSDAAAPPTPAAEALAAFAPLATPVELLLLLLLLLLLRPPPWSLPPPIGVFRLNDDCFRLLAFTSSLANKCLSRSLLSSSLPSVPKEVSPPAAAIAFASFTAAKRWRRFRGPPPRSLPPPPVLFLLLSFLLPLLLLFPKLKSQSPACCMSTTFSWPIL
mmetsp:Transcript_61806/g.123861  ORF Transcript_61806/g.123861 Transcript_61806/m.123861 type:complete len:209 (+) Transcript_61806:424-1050(+)